MKYIANALWVIWAFGLGTAGVVFSISCAGDPDSLMEGQMAQASLDHIVSVTVVYDDDDYNEYLMIDSDLDTFVAATKKLHNDPWVNPFDGREATKVAAIYVSYPRIDQFWWSAPSLQADDPAAAFLITWGKTECFWNAPGTSCEPDIINSR
ncbi:MAG: hypothetical protein ABIH67_02635 [Candidatus Uhrbacteria bacterium]